MAQLRWEVGDVKSISTDRFTQLGPRPHPCKQYNNK